MDMLSAAGIIDGKEPRWLTAFGKETSSSFQHFTFSFWHKIWRGRICGQPCAIQILPLPTIVWIYEGARMGAMNSTCDTVPSTNNDQVINAIMTVLAKQRSDGLEDLVDRFVEHGLGEVINSWISTEANLPVSVTQIRRILDRGLIDEIALQARISKREASLRLAVLLPEVINRLTPQGRIPLGFTLPEEMDPPGS
jgi:uncharacterized protein YidB (DUF937 family)